MPSLIARSPTRPRPGDVVGVDHRPEQPDARLHGRGDPEDPVVLVRPGEFAGRDSEFEAPDVRRSLCVRQPLLARLSAKMHSTRSVLSCAITDRPTTLPISSLTQSMQ